MNRFRACARISALNLTLFWCALACFSVAAPASARERTLKAAIPEPKVPVMTVLPPAAPRFKPLAVPQFVQSPAWVVVDVDSGRVLAGKNPHQRMFPASTTKTLMALTALSHAADLDEPIVIGPNPPKTGEQSAYLMQGERFVLRDLLRAAMIKSANDSCVAVAEGVSGTEANFIKMMNEEAKKVGAHDSHWMNPHGLHDPNHYTTPYDLAQIARAAMKFPFFNEIVKTRVTEIHGNWKIGAHRVLENKNRLLWEWNQCDGVKTGYTRQAGRCLIASATRSVRDSDGTTRPWRLVSVVMKSPDSWGESANLLMNAFAHFRPTSIVKNGQTFAPRDVRGGTDQVQPIASRALQVPLKSGENVSAQAHFLKLQAPIRRGQRVGELDLRINDQTIARLPLVAQNDVSVSLIAAVAPNAPFVPTNRTLILAAAGAAAFALALLLMRRARHIAGTHHVQKRTS